MATRNLFPEPANFDQPRVSIAPESLNHAEHRKLSLWAEERVPWVSRGALDSLTPLDEYVDACLSHFQSKKSRRPGWLGTIKNWIRSDERERLRRMALGGNEGARLALRDPKAWRLQFDRAERQMRQIAAPEHLIVPGPSASPGRSASIRHGRG